VTERDEVGFDARGAFVERSRSYLSGDYLPLIRRALARLGEEDLWWRPNAASNSAGNLVLHLAGNARQWIVSGVGGEADHRHRDAEFAAQGGQTRAEVLATLEQAVRDVDGALSRLDPAALGEVRTIQGREVTVMEAIYHVVEHFSMHTGQILYLVKLRTGGDLGLWRIGSDGSAHPTW